MAVLQIALGVLSLILAIVQVSEKTIPAVENIVQKQKEKNFYSVYHGNDPFYYYYSDVSGRYWVRIDTNGNKEYAENPNLIVIN